MLMGQFGILISSYQHQTHQCYRHRRQHKLAGYCMSRHHTIQVQAGHLVAPTATTRELFRIEHGSGYSDIQMEKLHTCRIRSILEASYIASCVSWKTNNRIWSEWNWTRVSPTGAFPVGSWIGVDLLFSHVSVFQTKSYRKITVTSMIVKLKSFAMTCL